MDCAASGCFFVCIFGCLRATNAYIAYVMGYNDQIWTDSEIREPLTDADIAAINEAL